jgi:hypothetical protein
MTQEAPKTTIRRRLPKKYTERLSFDITKEQWDALDALATRREISLSEAARVAMAEGLIVLSPAGQGGDTGSGENATS